MTETQVIFNTNMPVGGGEGGGWGIQFDPLPCGFLENVSSIEGVEPWFFMTFNTTLRHIFPENFIEFPQVV